MKPSYSPIAGSVLLLFCWLAFAGVSRSQVLTILHSFGDGTVTNDGTNPVSLLIQGSDGNIYGTTPTGGSANQGTVFKMTPQGSVTILHSFGDGSVADDGSTPQAELVQGMDGNFYGTTEFGGSTENGTANSGQGTVFKITPQGNLTILHSFGDGTVTPDGSNPTTGLLQASDGNFYGCTANNPGIDYQNELGNQTGPGSSGYTFKITPQGSYSILCLGVATSTLIQASDGNFYGGYFTGHVLPEYDGTSGNVSGIARITPQGAFHFSNFGQPFTPYYTTYGFIFDQNYYPYGSVSTLLQLSDGSVCGTTSDCLYYTTDYNNTVTGPATIFGLGGPYVSGQTEARGGSSSAIGSITTPVGKLLQKSDGYIYGVAEGTIYKISEQQVITVLHNFGDGSVPNDGSNPTAGLTLGSDGNLYGVTSAGGTAGLGTIFKLAPDASFISSAATASGSVSLPFSYQTTATYLPTNFSASNLPDGLSIDPATGLISGTPTTVLSKMTTITFNNSKGVSNSFALPITIGPLPVPVITSFAAAFGSVGNTFTYATVATNNATSYSATGLAGTGLSIDPSTGIISGTPSSTGTFPVTLTATNATGPSQSVNLSIQIFATPPTLSQEYTILGNGTGPSTIFQAFDGSFYGATNSGGPTGTGAVYKISPSGVISIFYPQGFDTFIQGSDGNFYATSGYDIYKLTLTGQLTRLNGFEGDTPANPGRDFVTLIQGADGNFYGTDLEGGNSGQGSIFEMTREGAIRVLLSFQPSIGTFPTGLVLATDGTFYGATTGGGTERSGTLYAYVLNEGVTVIHNFGQITESQLDNAPSGPPIQAADGNLYGAAGDIYKVTIQGTSYTYSLLTTGEDGNVANSIIQGADDNFYGTAGGSIYELAPQNGGTSYVYSTLHTFGDGTVPNDGTGPGPLIEGTDGNLYGTTSAGGTSGTGTFFAILAYLQPAVPPTITGSTTASGIANYPLFYGVKALQSQSGAAGITGALVKAATQPASSSIFAQALTFSMSDIVPADTNPPSTKPTRWIISGDQTPILPADLTFDAYTGTTTGIPVIAAGIYTFSITPQNSFSSGTERTVTMYIDSAPSSARTTVTDNATVSQTYSYQVTVTDYLSTVTYSANSLPYWLVIDQTAGVISGTPPNPGVYIFNPVATNTIGDTGLQVILTVGPTLPTDPVITSPASAIAYAGTNFYYRINANNNPTSYSALALPPGLLFNSATGEIYGLPTTEGTFLVPVSVTNASNTYSSVVTMTVGAGVTQVPALPTSLSANAVEGNPFSYQIPATGVLGTYSATTVNNQTGLPAGLSLDSLTGVISGTPTVTGTFQVTLTAANGAGISNNATLTLNVAAPVNFSQWEAKYPGLTDTVATDGPENDGVPNLLKYLYDINPTAPMSTTDRAALPVLSTATSGGVNYLTVTYRQYASVTGLTVNLQTSPDLRNWTTVNPPDLSQQIGSDPSTGDPIMEVGVITNGNDKQFLRLNVTQP